VHVARICTAQLAAVGPDTNSVGGRFAPGLDDLPDPAVAIGAVHLAPPSPGACAVRCRSVLVMVRTYSAPAKG
jgi:hypothetical protein